MRFLDAGRCHAVVELQEEAALPRPPVIFISIDTLAARHMSVYGYDVLVLY